MRCVYLAAPANIPTSRAIFASFSKPFCVSKAAPALPTEKFARKLNRLEILFGGVGFARTDDHKKGDVVASDESRGEPSLLIREILQHVVKHPDAKDTAEGIHKFWLSRNTAHHSREKVREALEHLVEKKGWLTKKVSGAVVLYGLNKDRMREVESFLQQAGKDD
jgi:hypothetical protein